MNAAGIELSLPPNTSLEEAMDMYISAVVATAGTQLKAAFVLGITPETISRRLRRRRKKLAVQNEITPDATGNR